MIEIVAQGVLIAALSMMGGYLGAYLLVAVADRLGLCYSAEREAYAHRNDPAPRFHA